MSLKNLHPSFIFIAGIAAVLCATITLWDRTSPVRDIRPMTIVASTTAAPVFPVSQPVAPSCPINVEPPVILQPIAQTPIMPPPPPPPPANHALVESSHIKQPRRQPHAAPTIGGIPLPQISIPRDEPQEVRFSQPIHREPQKQDDRQWVVAWATGIKNTTTRGVEFEIGNPDIPDSWQRIRLMPKESRGMVRPYPIFIRPPAHTSCDTLVLRPLYSQAEISEVRQNDSIPYHLFVREGSNIRLRKPMNQAPFNQRNRENNTMLVRTR
jgi:hypothetical protein